MKPHYHTKFSYISHKLLLFLNKASGIKQFNNVIYPFEEPSSSIIFCRSVFFLSIKSTGLIVIALSHWIVIDVGINYLQEFINARNTTRLKFGPNCLVVDGNLKSSCRSELCFNCIPQKEKHETSVHFVFLRPEKDTRRFNPQHGEWIGVREKTRNHHKLGDWKDGSCNLVEGGWWVVSSFNFDPWITLLDNMCVFFKGLSVTSWLTDQKFDNWHANFTLQFPHWGIIAGLGISCQVKPVREYGNQHHKPY